MDDTNDKVSSIQVATDTLMYKDATGMSIMDAGRIFNELVKVSRAIARIRDIREGIGPNVVTAKGFKRG